MSTTLGDFVRARREALGINQTELADRSDVPRETINRIENNKTALPMADSRRKLAKALGVSHLRILIEAGEITEQELGTTVGVVEVAPDDPREAFIERVRRLKWTDGVNRSLTFAIGIVEAEQGTSGE